MIEINDNTFENIAINYAELKARHDAAKAYLDSEKYPKIETIIAILGIERGESSHD